MAIGSHTATSPAWILTGQDIDVPTFPSHESAKEALVNISEAKAVLKNVLLDLEDRELTDDDAVKLALAIQEALRKLKK